jgi:glutamate--cysteine ligase catalytic subunit
VGSDSFIPKSRYSSISQYLSDVDWNLPEYSDLAFPLNKHMMEITRKEALRLGLKVDELLVKHLGFLTVRDFIVGYEKMLDEPE